MIHVLNNLEGKTYKSQTTKFWFKFTELNDNITVKFVNGKLHVGGTEKMTRLFNKMQEQKGFKS